MATCTQTSVAVVKDGLPLCHALLTFQPGVRPDQFPLRPSLDLSRLSAASDRVPPLAALAATHPRALVFRLQQQQTQQRSLSALDRVHRTCESQLKVLTLKQRGHTHTPHSLTCSAESLEIINSSNTVYHELNEEN